MKRDEKITIVGSGPVGTLLAIYLSEKNYKVDLFEKRNDPRTASKAEGRSINLALSHRGIRALKEIGLEEQIRSIAIPMKGRMIHDKEGNLNFQPYGKEGQEIYSVSRNSLNQMLIEKAAQYPNINISFNSFCEGADASRSEISISRNNQKSNITSDIIIGADGAFSSIRKSFAHFPDFTFKEERLSHDYKELHMNAGADGKHPMEKNALHIWPREQFMLIALPNTDGSFTCTLFLPVKGENSFEQLTSPKEVNQFFITHFSDVLPLIPDLSDNYFSHPESSLVTVHCFPWHYKKMFLVGDAAHAITPFYGQGMNAGFEDCRILNEIVEKENDWEKIIQTFQTSRKENGDAIAELALQNFIEMRDLVADEEFRIRKKIEAEIHLKYPAYLPLYTMVTFSDLPYKEALQLGKEHDRLMNEIMKLPKIGDRYKTAEGWSAIEKILTKYLH